MAMSFKVCIVGEHHLDELPMLFSDLHAAKCHAKSLIGRLADEAPDDTIVSVMDDAGTEIATYSVASWRMAVRFTGKKAYD
jgi:hypothetical protein